MRTKHLFMAALAFPLAFAACTNEELVDVNQPQVEANKVVGEELIAQGAVVTLVGDAESRFSNGGFDGTDRLGLAWWNNPKSAGKPLITDPQSASFSGLDKTGKIYNNLLVMKNVETDQFEVNGDIYANAYFLYFPYKSLGAVKALDKSYKDFVQKEAYSTKRNVEGKTYWVDGYMQNALHLSHKMLLSSEDAEDFVLDIDAYPVSAMNTLVVTTELGDKGGYSDELVSLIKLNKITIDSKTSQAFATKATVNPHFLPTLQAATEDATALENTAEVLKTALYNKTGDVALTLAEKSTAISTVVGYDNNITDDQLVALYSYSGKKITTAIPQIIVETNVGTFTYDSTDEEAPNYEAIVKLQKALKGEPYNANNAVYDNGAYNSTKPSFALTLDLEDMVLDTEVATAAEWNALMPFLAAAGDEEVTVTLTDNIQFGGEIDEVAQPDFTLPAGVKVTAEGAYSITFAGEQVIEDEFVSNVDINVAKDATLTVESEFTSADIVNKGTINVQEGAKIIGNAATKTLTNAEGVVNCDGEIQTNIEIANTDGIINVTYKKSYVAHDENGIIAGTLDTNVTEINDDPVAAIYQMIRDDAYAAVKCNQLTLKNFELAYGAKTSPWSTEKYQIGAGSFNGINLILENSSLATPTEMYINNLKATNSPINGIFHVTGNLETEGETLAGTYTVGGDMSVASATVEGDYTVTGDFKAENAELEGTYNANENVVLNAVIVAEGSEINAVGDMTINPTSTFTCTTLNANNVNIEGSTKSVTFLGTNLTASGDVIVNKAALSLKKHKHTVGKETTYFYSTIVAIGKVENENSGKVTVEEGSSITENYTEPINFAELEGNVKAAWTVLKNHKGNDFNEAYLVSTIQALTAEQVNNTTKAGAIYVALEAWFAAKGLEFSANNTEFTADYITLFNYLNEGTTNDLTY